MDTSLTERLRVEMRAEFARTGPPDGFPAFHDIPVERCTSEEFWRLEQEHLWPRVWVLAGRDEDVANPGDFITFDDLGPPILIVRGKDSVVRAFYNTCRHRGAPVVRDAAGSARTLRCQYHSWTYDVTTGALVHVPDERDFVGLVRDERCLVSLRCEVWDGWVFVNQDADAVPLLDWLHPIPTQLAQLQGRSLRTVARRSKVVTCNWKVAAEAFLEVYHFRHIHSRNGESQLDNRGATMGLLPNGHSRMVTPFSAGAATAAGMAAWDDWRHIEAPGFVDITSVVDMVRSTSTAYSVFPNLITPVAAYGFPFITFWPIDRRTTRIDWTHYAPIDFDPAPDGVESLPPVWERRMATFDQIMSEDFANLEPMQRSLESPALCGVPINYQERRIWHFHEQLDRTIGRDRIPRDMRVEPLLDRYVERE